MPNEKVLYAGRLRAVFRKRFLHSIPVIQMPELFCPKKCLFLTIVDPQEKSSNLSQKKSFALFSNGFSHVDSDVVLLDDPLSAVDAHVGQQLWQQCVCGLLASKTRVLVTHHMHFLQFADLIAVVEHGRISHLGSFQTLESQVSQLAS